MQLKSFPTIVQELGHRNRTIDILKIDVEGAEFSVFLDKQTMALMATLVRQILIEVHYKSEAQTVALARAFSEAGFFTFSKEPNIQACRCTCALHTLPDSVNATVFFGRLRRVLAAQCSPRVMHATRNE